MINNETDTTKYENYNKIYIPQNLYNDQNKYTLSSDTLTIITNNNCTTQNSQTTCDCTQYNVKYNIILGNGTYRCNRNPNTNNLVASDYITTDINYSDRITDYYYKDYYIIFAIIMTALIFFKALKGK